MQETHRRWLPRRSIWSPLVESLDRYSPYWEPQLVVAVALALDLALPERLTVGPSWLLPAVEGALLAGLIIVSAHPIARHSKLRRYVAIGLIALVSAVNIFSLALLCHYLVVGGKQSGKGLILAGAVLWLTNVLLFGLWFYELDRGGPVARLRGEPRYPDFQFVQMGDAKPYTPPDWSPRLVDYLYLSFTNATAFSPTDTMPLTAQAKWLMSAQALVSLVTVGLVVARAVNILA
jgi:uncharacterized membrane protein